MTNLSYLSEYQTFNNKYELNDAIASHLDRCRYELTETARDVFLLLSRYAVKYPGVAHLKSATIAKSIEKTDRTVRRAIALLIDLGMIERVEFMREKSGGNGANIYRICPPVTSARMEAVEPTPATVESGLTENEPFSFNLTNQLLRNTYSAKPSFYQRFKSLLSNTIGDTALASRFYGIYRAQSAKMLRFGIHADKGELFEDIALQALHITAQATKRKRIGNLTGYFDGVMRGLIDKALFSDVFKEFEVEPAFALCTH